MKKYFLKPVALKFIIPFFLILAALVIHSCKRDNKNNSPTADAVSQAKAWYESAYPVSGTTGGTLITQTVGGTHDLTQWVKPDWQHTVSYARLGKNVIEMPVDPASKFGSTLKIGNKLLNKAYSRSYFLLLNDGKTYQAYILTILADSSYVNNDLSKLAHNTYRKLDADFSGKIIYFTPRGAYLGGYGYKNGKLVAPPTATSQQTGPQQIQSVNTGNLKPHAIVQQCTDWYIAYFIDGVFQDADYLTTTCVEVDDGNNNASNNPPPPPPCPAGSHPGPPVTPPCIPLSSIDAVNSGHLTTNNLPVPPPDGGAPPPPGQTACSVDGQAKPCPDDITDPCAQKADIAARAANAIIAAQNTLILSNTTSTEVEYGTDQNLTSLTGTSYVNTGVTRGATDAWTPTFSWDSTNGYTVGFSHGHPGDTGPSPIDVYFLASQINTNAALRNNATNKQIYEAKASVTTLTSAGTYVVTINDWTAISTVLTNSYSTPAQVAAFNNNYQAIGQQYISDNGSATKGDAGVFALMQLFPGAINVYYAPTGSNTYTPLTINTAVNGNKTIGNLPCPQ